MKMEVLYNQSLDYRWRARPVPIPESQISAQSDGATVRWEKGASSEGACLALSTLWLVKKAKNVDFWAWLNPPPVSVKWGYQGSYAHAAAHGRTAVDEVDAFMQAQKQRLEGSEVGAVEKQMLVDEVVREKTSLKRDMDLDMFANVLDNLPNAAGYVYLSISCASKKFFHGIAVHIDSANKARVFDPNSGEGSGIPGGRVQAFVKFLAAKTYDLPPVSGKSTETRVDFIRFT